jgi:type IV pilus assembly protein PilF
MRRLEALLTSLACGLLLASCASAPADQPAVEVAPDTGPSPVTDARLNLTLAENYLAKGDLAKAAQRADLAIAAKPDWGQAHAIRAMVFARAGDSAKAGKQFDRALALAPADGAILNAHASWLCEHGQADAADREFVKALADPAYRTPVQALANAGKCALSTNRLAAAEDYLRRALVFAPNDPTLLQLLADVELRQGKVFEAQAFIQRRDALGADGATLDLAARIEDAAGNAQGAARYRARLHSQFPDYAPTGEGARKP